MTDETPADDLPARQAKAVREGRRAESAGRPVIYIHGRPYKDPGADDERDDTGEDWPE